MIRYNITCNIKEQLSGTFATATQRIRCQKLQKIEYLQRLGICANEIKALYLDTSINLK